MLFQVQALLVLFASCASLACAMVLVVWRAGGLNGALSDQWQRRNPFAVAWLMSALVLLSVSFGMLLRYSWDFLNGNP